MTKLLSWLFLIAIAIWAALSLFGVASEPSAVWTFIALAQFLVFGGIPSFNVGAKT